MWKGAGRCMSLGIENMSQNMWNLCKPAPYDAALARDTLEAASASSCKTGLLIVEGGGEFVPVH